MASLVDVDTDYKLLLRYSIPFCGAHFGAFTVYTARSIRVPFFFCNGYGSMVYGNNSFAIAMDAGIGNV